MDHRALVVLLSLWSSGFWTGVTGGAAVMSDGVTFEEGKSRCSGTLEIKHQGNWTTEDERRLIDEKCRQLNCGPASLWQTIRGRTSSLLRITCAGFRAGDTGGAAVILSDGVTFEEEASRCDGTMVIVILRDITSEMKLNMADFLCRRLGCGTVVWLQTTQSLGLPLLIEFTCSGFWAGDTGGAAVILSDGVMFEEGESRCSGKSKIKHQVNWTTEDDLTPVAVMCRQLDCGSVVLWKTIRNLASSSLIEFTCSESVRLNGTNRCSGRLEVKSDETWSSVCEGEFDQQVAEVVCRELDCGVPSVLQGALYGEVEAPVRSREFQCEGNESHLLECHRSTCSSGRALGLTCSDHDDVRLVGGASHCSGELELKHHGVWGAVGLSGWDLKGTTIICHHLNCGSLVSTRTTYNSSTRLPVWEISLSCFQSIDQLMECVTTGSIWSFQRFYITCAESVRLNGTNRCSGRLEVKSDESWSSVCEGEFDQQVAEVVCRELDCGVPSVPQGALYGEVEAPVRSRKFRCEGNESHLLECEWSESVTSTCSPDKAVGLTCSGRLRLVGEASRCAGELKINNQGEYRPGVVYGDGWNQTLADKVCTHLDCGSVVSTNVTDDFPDRLAWSIDGDCAQSESSLWECVIQWIDDLETNIGIQVICSDLLFQPKVSASPIVGVSGAKQQGLHVLLGYSFTVTCSTEPQYQGGSFQLLFTSSDTTQNYTLPAVNHSAHFLFPAARSAHRGDYTCVYHAYVFSYNFSSKSRPLHLIVSASVTDLIIRCVVALLLLTVSTPILYFHFKAAGRRRTEQNLQLLIAQRKRPETRQRRRRSTAAAGRRTSRVNVE